MSHTITESDTFTSTITVPDGADDHHGLSAAILSFVQALANRTKNLNLHSPRIDDQARNQFMVGEEFHIVAADLASRVSRTSAADDPHAGNKWKAQDGFRLGGTGAYDNIYSGVVGGEADYALVINAVWDPVTQLWHSDDHSLASTALLVSHSAGLRISTRAPGAGTWATWPTGAGNVAAHFILGDSIASSSTVTANTDVNLNGEVLYLSGKTRTFTIPLTDYIGPGVAQIVSGGLIAIGWPTSVTVPNFWRFRASPGMVMGDIKILVFQQTTTPATAAFLNRSCDFSTATVGGGTIATGTGPAASGLHYITINTSGVTPDVSGSEYFIKVTPGDYQDGVYAIGCVGCTDVGPRGGVV